MLLPIDNYWLRGDLNYRPQLYAIIDHGYKARNKIKEYLFLNKMQFYRYYYR